MKKPDTTETAEQINARRKAFLEDWLEELTSEEDRLYRSLEEWQHVRSQGWVWGHDSEMARADAGTAMDEAELEDVQRSINYVVSHLAELSA